MGIGQYNSLREYCGPQTASSVFLILVWLLHCFLLANHFYCKISDNTIVVSVLMVELSMVFIVLYDLNKTLMSCREKNGWTPKACKCIAAAIKQRPCIQ